MIRILTVFPISSIIEQQPPQINSYNVGLTCYCWAVEGGRDVHFQLCGLCQASHHSLKDVTQRFFGFCQKILGRKKNDGEMTEHVPD